MKAVSDILLEKGYQLDAELDHRDLIPFIKTNLFKRNKVTIAFLCFTLLFVLCWITISVFSILDDRLNLIKILTGSALGIVISLLLAPVHEVLHGAAYRICGAPVVSYKVNWKKYYIMAIADQFVTGRKAFYFIGSIPFIVISLGLILLICTSNAWFQVVWSTALWLHATMCAGDFGLMSYFAEHPNRDVVTFDDTEKSISYFYSKRI